MTSRLIVKFLSVLMSLLVASPGFAAYNANIAGIPMRIITGENGLVLFSLSTQPTSHPACSAVFFVIDNSLDAATINRMYARLLAAQTTGESINIGYDNSGSCLYGYMHAYQIG